MTIGVNHVSIQVDIRPLLLLGVAAFLAWVFLRMKNKRRRK